MTNRSPAIEMLDVLDAQDISGIYAKHRGKCICIAGQELLVAVRVQDAIALATAAHPDDEGWFTRYIPKEKVARIYAV